MRFLRNGEIYYIYFIDNLLLFPTVKEFSKSVNSLWSYRKKFNSMFFSETQCICIYSHYSNVNVKAHSHRARLRPSTPIWNTC